MKISGNQTAIKEMMNLLDPKFVPPFICKKNENGKCNCLGMSCKQWTLELEQVCDSFEVYKIEYDGNIISKYVKLYDQVGCYNLLSGRVR